MQLLCKLGNEKFQEIENQNLGILGGEPGGIRTRDPQLRRLLLYPAELPVRAIKLCDCKVKAYEVKLQVF